jgi:hypothetical protein
VPALLAQDEARMSEDGYDSANALLNSFGAKLNFVACVDWPVGSVLLFASQNVYTHAKIADMSYFGSGTTGIMK